MDTCVLSAAQSAAIGAVVNGQAHGVKDQHGRLPHHACTTARALERAGYPAEVLADLEESGWLVGWDRRDGRFLTLTPEGAEAANVELAEHIEFAAVDHPSKTRKPLGRITRDEDGKIPRDRDGRIRRGPGNVIPRDPPTGKAVPERVQQVTEEPHWRPSTWLRDEDGGGKGPPREPIVLPVRHREVYLCEYHGIHPASKEMSPVDELIAAEEIALAEERAARGALAGGLGEVEPEPGVRFAMEEARAADGRLEVDERTGKVKLRPVRILGEMAQVGRKKKARAK